MGLCVPVLCKHDERAKLLSQRPNQPGVVDVFLHGCFIPSVEHDTRRALPFGKPLVHAIPLRESPVTRWRVALGAATRGHAERGESVSLRRLHHGRKRTCAKTRECTRVCASRQQDSTCQAPTTSLANACETQGHLYRNAAGAMVDWPHMCMERAAAASMI
jgi:hypothetical protein